MWYLNFWFFRMSFEVLQKVASCVKILSTGGSLWRTCEYNRFREEPSS